MHQNFSFELFSTFVTPTIQSFLQLRETVNNFFQKELAPYADQIDKDNNFPQLRVSDID